MPDEANAERKDDPELPQDGGAPAPQSPPPPVDEAGHAEPPPLPASETKKIFDLQQPAAEDLSPPAKSRFSLQGTWVVILLALGLGWGAYMGADVLLRKIAPADESGTTALVPQPPPVSSPATVKPEPAPADIPAIPAMPAPVQAPQSSAPVFVSPSLEPVPPSPAHPESTDARRDVKSEAAPLAPDAVKQTPLSAPPTAPPAQASPLTEPATAPPPTPQPARNRWVQLYLDLVETAAETIWNLVAGLF